MTEFIISCAIWVAAIGLGVGLSATNAVAEPSLRPAVLQNSEPVGTPASDTATVAHPVMPTDGPERTGGSR